MRTEEIKMFFISSILLSLFFISSAVLSMGCCGDNCGSAKSVSNEVENRLNALYEDYFKRGRCEVKEDCTMVDYDGCYEYGGCDGIIFYREFENEFNEKKDKIEGECEAIDHCFSDWASPFAIGLPPLLAGLSCARIELGCINNRCVNAINYIFTEDE